MGTRTNMLFALPAFSDVTRHRHLPVTMAALLFMASPVAAQESERPDRFQFNVDLGHTRDSNYDRLPDNDPEQITTGKAGIRLNQTLSRQHFNARAAVTRYRFDERDELDTSIWSGGVGWQGSIGSRFKPSLSWSQTEQLVDRAEFEGRDILTDETVRGGLVYSLGPHWNIPVRAQRVEQEHSNETQTALDYIDEQVSVGASYVSDRNSSAGINLIHGDREYPNQNRTRPEDIPDRDDLDYDYWTVELETNWVISPKTQLEGRLGFFERDGEANDGSGGYALIEARWKPTYKTRLTTGVQYTEPAIGETANSPSEIERIYIDAEWQATPKILLSSGYSWSNNRFDTNTNRESRTEELQVINPLTARYQMNETLAFYLRSTWVDRSSPVDDREFDATIVKVGLDLAL
ncbi:hypothetical protein ACFOZ5_18585 [Marinobacter lacisalsi]|uniref:Outer membrane beta-barrel protein n=1 Tax=Marinobacter lacisalsi TaxID=475979 RepID=A0ABV8QMK6_9GAMM